MKIRRSLKFLGLLAITNLLSFSSAQAGGVDLTLLHGSRYIYLGGHHVSLGGDAYGVFYNPANMTSVKSPTFVANSTNLIFNQGGPIGADNAQRKSEISWGPFFYLGGVYPLNDRVAFGLAAFPVAAQGGKYKGVDYGPLFTDKDYYIRMMRLEISPAVAFKLMDHVSFGAAWKIGYTQFDKRVGTFGTAALTNLDATYATSSLSTWDAKGLKVGLFVDDINGLSAGLTYRTENPLTLEGNTKLYTALAATGTDFDTKQNLTIPQQIQFGLSYEWVPDTFMTAFTYDYTISSVLKDDAPVLAGIPAAATNTPLNYRDGHTFHMGAEYTFHLGGKSKLRTGVGIAIDTAVSRDSHPSPILSPADTYVGYAAGAQYDTGKHVIGLGASSGTKSANTSAAELNPAMATKAFAGKYEAVDLTFGVDYQFRY